MLTVSMANFFLKLTAFWTGNAVCRTASYCMSSDKHPRTKVQFGTVLKSQGYAQVRDSTGRYWQGLTTFVVT